MKLYRTATGAFVATQAEAGKGFRPVEVPSVGRSELAAFLNDLVASELETSPPELTRDEILNSNTPEAQEAAKRLMAPTPINAGVAKVRTADDIVAFILDEAAVHQVENIMAAIGTRFGELAKEHRHGRG